MIFGCIQEKIIHVLGKTQACIPMHSVAIWTFTFHEKSGCVQLIWNKENEQNRSEFPDQKVEEFGLQVGLKFAFQINYTEPDIS